MKSKFKMINKDLTEKLPDELKIRLTNIGKTQMDSPLVHLSTQKEYDCLMQSYEAANKFWSNKKLATSKNHWPRLKNDSHIHVLDHYDYEILLPSPASWMGLNGGNSISLQEFYTRQKIDPEKILKLNQWFEQYKPNRESKG